MAFSCSQGSRRAEVTAASICLLSLLACGGRAPAARSFTHADDPYLLGPPKREPAGARVECVPGAACPYPQLVATGPGVAPPLTPPAVIAPPTSIAPPDDPLANAATLDPDAPMPKQSVSTNATLQLGQAASAMVDARSDLFSSALPEADRNRGGVLPAIITLAAAGGALTFSDVRGRIGCVRGSYFEADGGKCVGGNTNLRSAGFVSGLVAHERSLFLTGVFLGDPPGPAPDGIDFSQAATGMSFTQLSPGLGQSFFIGDGLTGTGSGAAQRFRIPPGATKLYLGIVDGQLFQGYPGAYGDNTGSMFVRITQRAE